MNQVAHPGILQTPLDMAISAALVQNAQHRILSFYDALWVAKDRDTRDEFFAIDAVLFFAGKVDVVFYDAHPSPNEVCRRSP